MDYTLLILGILALSTGLFLWFLINKRKFNRRNFAGGEGFSSYEKSLLIRFLEQIGRWLSFILIIAGLLFLWGYSKNKKNLEQVAIENITLTKSETV
nr:molybdenum ABC transporter permease [uncultured Flavobacterium sp.]